jgi:hypothetical protein
MITEEYVEMQPRIVAIAFNVPMKRQKWVSMQRQISIPRPMIEKRVVRKMVPKVIQIEHAYEVEAGCMEEEFFMQPANTSAQYGAAGYMQSAQSPTRAAYGQFAGAFKSNFSAQTGSPVFLGSSSVFTSPNPVQAVSLF